MQRSSNSSGLLEVYQRELDEIIRRRREAGVAVEGDDETARRQVANDLVGLALSGGGVRSASFNLGLIQAMYESGLLRDVDYLSTVSGGGYVGACLSSAALKPETRFDWQHPNSNGSEQHVSQKPETPSANGSERGFELAEMPDGRQPKRVNELIHSGTSLRRPLVFLNRYLIGVVLTNIVVLSGLFALCALAAFLFRCTDYRIVINWLYALGFRGDIMRAFFPSVMFFALWLIFWAISYWRKGVEATGRIARVFLALTIVSVLMAVAMLVGTGDVSLTYFRDNWGIEPPKEALESFGRDIQKLFFIALFIALLPYLRVRDLIRSGTRPKNVFEGWIFAIATRGLLYGIPLLVFGYFAREDISGFNAKRMSSRHGVAISHRADIQPLDFTDWRGTWREIELESSSTPHPNGSQPAESDRYSVGRKMWRLAGQDRARASIQIVDDMAKFDSEYGDTQRWLLLLGHLATREPNALTEQFERRQQQDRLQKAIAENLTAGLLCSRKAYQLFEDAKLDFPNLNREQLDKLDRELAGLLAKGRLLDDRITHLERRYPVSFEQWLETHPLPVDFDMKVREQYARTEEELKDVNWQLLRTYFGNQLAPKSTIYAANVLQHDQTTRLIWLVGSLVIFLISGSLVNLNATSLQGYYRDGISNVWIDEVPGFGRSIPLTSLDTTSRGAPYHLVNATVHLMGRRLDMDQPVTDAFLFSRCYCGSKRTGFSPTDEYDDGRYDLPNAIAVSGAAVTPSQVHNPLLAVLLFISNSRLGQWLPNPAYNNRLARTVNKRLRLPFSPIRLMIGLFQPAERRNHCFVADGGHHENLGLEVLLERRVRTIIVSDVTCDFNYQFEDLVQLHRRIAARLGIRIDGFSERDDFLDLAPLVPDKETRFSRQHVICARIRYPRLEYLGEFGEPMQGLLLYVKPGLTGDEPLDLRSHQEHSPMFPHDTTADQFYDPDRFESYRQLGFHIGQELSKVYQERIRSTDVSDHGGKPGGHRPSLIGTAGTSSNGDSEDGDNDNSQRDLHFLIQRLSHENSDYRLLAIHAIGELIPALNANAKQNAVRALTDVLSQPTSDKSLLEKTVWALGEAGLGIASEAERIMAFVENHEGDVRIRAAALELLRDLISESDELREHLERLRRDSSPMIQQKAAVLLNEQTAE